MPHFRLKNPMPHLIDALFRHDVNPDPERYEEVPEAEEAPAAAPEPATPLAEPAPAAPPTEETTQ